MPLTRPRRTARSGLAHVLDRWYDSFEMCGATAVSGWSLQAARSPNEACGIDSSRSSRPCSPSIRLGERERRPTQDSDERDRFDDRKPAYLLVGHVAESAAFSRDSSGEAKRYRTWRRRPRNLVRSRSSQHVDHQITMITVRQLFLLTTGREPTFSVSHRSGSSTTVLSPPMAIDDTVMASHTVLSTFRSRLVSSSSNGYFPNHPHWRTPRSRRFDVPSAGTPRGDRPQQRQNGHTARTVEQPDTPTDPPLHAQRQYGASRRMEVSSPASRSHRSQRLPVVNVDVNRIPCSRVSSRSPSSRRSSSSRKAASRPTEGARPAADRQPRPPASRGLTPIVANATDLQQISPPHPTPTRPRKTHHARDHRPQGATSFMSSATSSTSSEPPPTRRFPS